jgi:hypothetical protein
MILLWIPVSDAEDLRALKSHFGGEILEAVTVMMTVSIFDYKLRIA